MTNEIPAAAPAADKLAEVRKTLDGFAARHGRDWKTKLRVMWCNGMDAHEPDGSTLRAIRNSPALAFEFLDKYKPTKIETGFSVGQRVQAHPATDTWMRGDRFGTVAKISGARVHVKMDISKRTIRFAPDYLLAAD